MWQNKMFDGIKTGQSRMEIAKAIGIPVRAVSLAALQMQSSPDYREAGITDEQFAEWFERSLIGLKTADGELVIERTEPLQKNVDSVLANIKKFDKQCKEKLPNEPIGNEIYLSVCIRNCWNCRNHGLYQRCACKPYSEDRSIGCKHFEYRRAGEKERTVCRQPGALQNAFGR